MALMMVRTSDDDDYDCCKELIKNIQTNKKTTEKKTLEMFSTLIIISCNQTIS